MNLKQINSGIRSVATSGTKFVALVQATAVGIIQHAEATGDCTPALRLVKAMPASMRRERLIRFFAAYSPIGMNVKEDKVGLIKATAKNYVAFNATGAAATSWDVDPAREDSDGNLPDTTLETVQKQIGSLAKRLQGLVKDNRIPANDLPEVNSRIEALVAMGPVDEVASLRAEVARLKQAA